MTGASHSQIIRSRRIPEVLHQHGIWRRSAGLGTSKMKSRRRFSFTQQEIETSTAVKVYYEDSVINTESAESREFVLPSPPISVWSFAMSSEELGEVSEDFVLCDPKNLRYHREGSTVTSSSVRQSINTTNADYGFSVATSDSESSFSKEEEICSDLLSLLSDIPREIVIQKSLSQRFPLLRRLSRKLFRQSKLEL